MGFTNGHPVNIAILWHMHQPFYYDPELKKFKMPWVRLHATKDYLDMLLVARESGARPVFNFTPSLLLQLQMYLNGVPELHLELTLRDPRDLSEQEKILVLKDFFMANWETMIKPFPRYYELLLKRSEEATEQNLTDAARFFTRQDFLDLQLLFNLVWVDPVFRKNDEFLKYLEDKGRGFTAQDKERLIGKHMEIIGRIFGEYRNAVTEGDIEISASPFYHPILPLLIDTNIARVPHPATELPSRRFRYPQDARAQIQKSLDYMTGTFGVTPGGMWPSEGSVSDDALALMAECGIRWAATDEMVLLNSLNASGRKFSGLPAEALYRPYAFEFQGRPINVFFRDHKLSDNIGFVYSRLAPEDAVSHFMNCVHNIRNHLMESYPREDYIIPVILDGENAWEFYKDDGTPFLRRLYSALMNDSTVNMVTFSEFLERYPRTEKLPSVVPGSWIDANFKIWIGHNEDNTAWDHLTEARSKVEELRHTLAPEVLETIMQSVYIAEGSDWCWWYGDEHSTELDIEFDELFRSYVKDIYFRLGLRYPDRLDTPIVHKIKEIKPEKELQGFITPRIDGRVTSYFEWLGSYMYDLKKFGFAMHRTSTYMDTLHIGFDTENIYFRLDPETNLSKSLDNFPLVIEIAIPSCGSSIRGEISAEFKADFLFENAGHCTTTLDAAFDRVLEIKLPVELTGLKPWDNLTLVINIRLSNLESIRFPPRGNISMPIPPSNFEEYIWQA